MYYNKLLLCIVFSITPVFSTTYKLTHQRDNPWPGFFSVINMVLGALDFYERAPGDNGFIIDFEDQGLFYDPNRGPNWWNYYFEPITIEPLHEQEVIFKTYKKIVFSFFAQLKMSRERGHELIKKFVRVKPHIQKKVDTFVDEYFNGAFVIGIHYRATDKVIEAPTVDYERVKNSIQNEVMPSDNALIFVATDDENFLQYMYQQFPGKIIATNALRSSDGKAVHTDVTKDAYQKGEDALIDCLILSRCSKLYKTASNLSDVAIKFNPFIPVVSLSQHYIESTRYAHYNTIKVLGTIVTLLDFFEKNPYERGFTAYFPTLNTNWWEKLFKPLSVGTSHCNLALTDTDLTILGFSGIYDIPAERAYELLTKYVQVHPSVQKKIDELYTKKLSNSFVISVFYMKETTISYETYNTMILKTRQIFKNAPDNKKILLISNDETFVALMNKEFHGYITHPLLNSWKLRNGESDLLYCLAMARSQCVIGSQSIYLKLVQQFNPQLPIIEFGTYWLEQ